MALSDDANELSRILSEIKAAMDDAAKSTKVLTDGIGFSKDSLTGLISAAKEYSQDRKRWFFEENKLSSDQLKDLRRKIQLEKENISQAQQALKAQQVIAEKQKLSNESLIKSLKLKASLESLSEAEQVVLQEALNKNKELKQTIAEQGIQMAQNQKVLKDFDGSIRNIEKGIDKATKKATIFEKLGGIGKQLDKIPTQFDEYLIGPLGLLNKLIGFTFSTVSDYDKRLGETAKSMNMTYDATDKSNRAMKDFADATGDAQLNSKFLNQTTTELNKTLGTSVAFEKMGTALQEDVALMSKLENVAGLTGEQTQAIMKYSMGTGQSAKNVTKELMASYRVQGLKSGLVLNEKDAMKAIEKTSKATQMSYGGNAKELGKALAAAKGLGVELNKVEDIAGSLLNFEESIENELSAELLTGKELNLEKARSAALNNDLATVAEEITKQVGSAADFANMNRIQQDAIAKSVGMTREELAASLMEQEALKNIGAASLEEAREKYDTFRKTMSAEEAMKALGDEALANQFEQTNIAERKALAEEKMADLIIDSLPAMQTLADIFQTIFDTVNYILGPLGGMKVLAVTIGAIMVGKVAKGMADFVTSSIKGVQMLGKFLGLSKEQEVVEKSMKVIKKSEARSDVVSGSYKMASWMGPLGAGLVGGLIGAGLTALMMNDGIIKPSGTSGYGDRVLLGPEGAIKFNNKDTIVAGTDLFADDAVMEPGKATQSASKGEIKIKSEGGGGQDMSSIVSAITALANRPVNVGIDGKKVIEATTGAQPNTYGDETAKNSYRIQ